LPRNPPTAYEAAHTREPNCPASRHLFVSDMDGITGRAGNGRLKIQIIQIIGR
jgi:hypothetical protein